MILWCHGANETPSCIETPCHGYCSSCRQDLRREVASSALWGLKLRNNNINTSSTSHNNNINSSSKGHNNNIDSSTLIAARPLSSFRWAAFDEDLAAFEPCCASGLRTISFHLLSIGRDSKGEGEGWIRKFSQPEFADPFQTRLGRQGLPWPGLISGEKQMVWRTSFALLRRVATSKYLANSFDRHE